MAVLCCWLRCAADCAACWLNGDGWLCAGLIAGCTNCWLYQLLAVLCWLLAALCWLLAALIGGCAQGWSLGPMAQAARGNTACDGGGAQS